MSDCSWCHTTFTKQCNSHRFCSTRCRVAGHREGQRTLPLQGPRNASSRNARVAALYVRADGCYASMDVDLWDIQRDAALYDGPGPVVAHPPCGPWGRYRHTCTRQRADLAVRAVEQVRRHGGVLEHPAGSHLWLARELPKPGETHDSWGGWSLLIRQGWFGHRAPKATWLYIVGANEHPPLPDPKQDPGGRVENMGRRERELTPPALARWLVALAEQCSPGRFRRVTRSRT